MGWWDGIGRSVKVKVKRKKKGTFEHSK